MPNKPAVIDADPSVGSGHERRAALRLAIVPMIASTSDGRHPDRHAFHLSSFR
jgi:hypothetical protein